MNYWAEIAGQPAAVEVLEHASTDSRLAHAWLITGPPGSGRSNLALRFAAALVARSENDREAVYAQVAAHTHQDVTVLATQNVIIGIEDVREIVSTAYYGPAEGRYRIIVIEDADRMPERTSNVLLKALEEPPERTVWVLCSPSEADLLPTIRSRVRTLRLVTPPPAAVAELLHERDGIELGAAERASRLAQGHIGMARRLATSPEALDRRERAIAACLGVFTLSDAMAAAAELLKIAEADAKALGEKLDAEEREQALRGLGIAPGAAVPPQLRAQIRALEEEQKRRATRSLRDGVDRILTDMLSVYRDVVLTAQGAGLELINTDHAARITELAQSWGATRALEAVTAVEAARERLHKNVSPGLVLEAALTSGVATSGAATSGVATSEVAGARSAAGARAQAEARTPQSARGTA